MKWKIEKIAKKEMVEESERMFGRVKRKENKFEKLILENE